VEKWKSKLKVLTGISTYFPSFQLAALIVMLGFRAVVAQEAAPFEVPKEIVHQLVMSGVDPESIDLQDDGTARGLSGAVVELNGDKQRELVVSGKYGIEAAFVEMPIANTGFFAEPQMDSTCYSTRAACSNLTHRRRWRTATATSSRRGMTLRSSTRSSDTDSTETAIAVRNASNVVTTRLTTAARARPSRSP